MHAALIRYGLIVLVVGVFACGDRNGAPTLPGDPPSSPVPTVTPTPTNVRAVAVGGYHGRDGQSGAIVESSDGGLTWNLLLDNDLQLWSVDFVSPQTGWAVGWSSLRITTDGGGSWNSQNDNIANDGYLSDLYAVRFRSSTEGIAVGAWGDNSLNHGPIILVTADAGQFWNVGLILPSDNPALANGTLWDACFLEDGTAIAVGNGTRGAIVLLSVDGGETWHDITDRFERAPKGNGVACVGDSLIWIVGEEGELFHSKDAGGTWIDLSANLPPLSGALRSVSFRNANEGIAGGDGPVLLETSDGGQTWTQVELPPTNSGKIWGVKYGPSGALAVGEERDDNDRQTHLVLVPGPQGWQKASVPQDVSLLTDVTFVP
ncbi:MAG TPA: YCF48-related protein [Candidatus Binatia bacterium]